MAMFILWRSHTLHPLRKVLGQVCVTCTYLRNVKANNIHLASPFEAKQNKYGGVLRKVCGDMKADQQNASCFPCGEKWEAVIRRTDREERSTILRQAGQRSTNSILATMGAWLGIAKGIICSKMWISEKPRLRKQMSDCCGVMIGYLV